MLVAIFKASLSRLATNRLSLSAKTLAISSVSSSVQNVLSHYSSCSDSFFFFVWLLACFIKNLLALSSLCFHVEDIVYDHKNPIYVKKITIQIFYIFYENIIFFNVFALITECNTCTLCNIILM